jgi:hypothetical protein
MDNAALLFLVPLIGAGAGAYLGSYLKKKGENLATHEDIDKLVHQMTAVTQATKSIEATISNEVWERQRKWDVKREALFDVAKLFGKIKSLLISMNSAFSWEEPTGPEPPPSRASWHARLLTQWQEVWVNFETANYLASLMCGEEVRNRLRELNESIGQTVSDTLSGKAAPDWMDRLVAQIDRVIAAVRKELHVD